MSLNNDYHMDTIDEDFLKICFSCGCINISKLPASFDCIGCSGKSECCCVIHECCCTTDTPPLCCMCDDPPNSACCLVACVCCTLYCKKPQVCCKLQGHTCCLVCSGSIPTDMEVPFILTCCCITCYPKCGICLQIRDVNNANEHYYPNATQIYPSISYDTKT
jgi:hypothetical protein